MALFRFLKHGRGFPWGATAVLGAHTYGGARRLSYVPVDNVVSGLTEDQIQVKYCVIPFIGAMEGGVALLSLFNHHRVSGFYGSMDE